MHWYLGILFFGSLGYRPWFPGSSWLLKFLFKSFQFLCSSASASMLLKAIKTQKYKSNKCMHLIYNSIAMGLNTATFDGVLPKLTSMGLRPFGDRSGSEGQYRYHKPDFSPFQTNFLLGSKMYRGGTWLNLRPFVKFHAWTWRERLKNTRFHGRRPKGQIVLRLGGNSEEKKLTNVLNLVHYDKPIMDYQILEGSKKKDFKL